MLKVCERFPQIGGIRDYLSLSPGERALYQQYTLDALEAEAKIHVLKFNMKGGGRG